MEDMIKQLIPPKRSTAYAYRMGYDCGLKGVTEENCHFSIYSSPENTSAWERGKRDALEGKPMSME